MPSATLAITVPEDVWIGELSRQYPDTEFEILTAFPKGTGGVALAEITGADPRAVVREMDDYDEVTNTDLLQQTDESVLVQFVTSDPVLLLPVREAGTPLELPFTVQNGTADWEITTTRDHLSTLADQLREFGITFDVRSVVHRIETDQLLTEKQTRLLKRAVETGYYDTPRETTLTELAEAVDIAKSTCSETLHRTEEKIVKQFAKDIDDIDTEFSTP